MKRMLKDELKARSVRNKLNGSCWYGRPLDPTHSPRREGEKKKDIEKESRDIDLALFMPNAIGRGTRCFTFCLHRAATRLRKRKYNQGDSLFVVCR